MAFKGTIALVGLADKKCTSFVKELVKEKYRLLLISKPGGEDILAPLKFHTMIQQSPDGAIEIIDCVKNACWEADIIALIGEGSMEHTLIKRIKEVATQKIVVAVAAYEDKALWSSLATRNIQQLLPHSKVVQALNQVGAKEVSIAGNDEKAVQVVSTLAKAIGYTPTPDPGIKKII